MFFFKKSQTFQKCDLNNNDHQRFLLSKIVNHLTYPPLLFCIIFLGLNSFFHLLFCQFLSFFCGDVVAYTLSSQFTNFLVSVYVLVLKSKIYQYEKGSQKITSCPSGNICRTKFTLSSYKRKKGI